MIDEGYLAYLMALRDYELDAVLRFLPPPGANVLEIGGGTGHQARKLAKHGYQVTSVDVGSSQYAEDREFAVQEYDGVHLPTRDASMDCLQLARARASRRPRRAHPSRWDAFARACSERRRQPAAARPTRSASIRARR